MNTIEDTFGTWQEQKAIIDSYDDGYGPYLYWILSDEDQFEILWPDFKQWAIENLACGISFACLDGSLIVPAADAAFRSYVAGRNYRKI